MPWILAAMLGCAGTGREADEAAPQQPRVPRADAEVTVPVSVADMRSDRDGSAPPADAFSGTADAARDLGAPPDGAPPRVDGTPAPEVDAAPMPDLDAAPMPDVDAAAPVHPALPWDDDPCATLDVGNDPFADLVARFSAADDAAPPTPGGLVVLGSSTVRRWEDAQRLLAAWDPLQRGLGGARLADLARWAEPLVVRHAPSGVLVFAGTNDIADGRTAQQTFDAFRCLVTRVDAAQPGTPVLFIGITPAPSRWGTWPAAADVNARIAELAEQHPSIFYVDTPSAFLETGSPPDPSLFVGDQLHLSDTGYALWGDLVRDAVEAHLPRAMSPLPPGPPPGTYLRVDLGPSNPEDGRLAPASDRFDIRWNAWPGARGGEQVLAGEALRGLVSTRGERTQVDVLIAGGFRTNGLRNGGLLAPDFAHLGTLAVPEATEDFFFTAGPDDPAGLTFSGLSPDATHTLRLFASRASNEERRTSRFIVYGGGPPSEATVLTTGPGIGVDGGDANVSELVVFMGLRPDARGRLHLDVRIDAGQFAYLNLLELEVEPAR
jgi:lysophospholipase L1-like esterase